MRREKKNALKKERKGLRKDEKLVPVMFGMKKWN